MILMNDEGGRVPTIPEPTAIASADLTDALRELDDAQRRSKRHLMWALLGLSPAALIPFMGLLAEGSFGLIVVLVVLVLLVEGWRYVRAEKEASRLRAVVKLLEVGHPESAEHPVPEVEP